LTIGLAVVAAGALAIPVAGLAQSAAELCVQREPGVDCGPGNDRQPPGGGGAGKVPHDNGLNRKSPATRVWPKLSGILWMVTEDSRTPHAKVGGPLNDELLGHHGSDTLTGGPGHDILWGDWDPSNNNSAQRDILSGGAGNDWLYPSHGKSIVKGGTGSDYIWAFYGKGTIDCGPGVDTARIRTTGAFKTKGCEKIRHFCSNGENAQGQCLSPTGKPVAASRRVG
jgi:Ca2+-binding RTX toxin-like protein